MSYKVKLDANAIKIYEGADEYMSVPIKLGTVYGDDTEAEFSKITIPANAIVKLDSAGGATFFVHFSKRKAAVSSSLPIESPMLLFMSCDKFKETQIGEFGVLTFKEGINDVVFRNSSSYPVNVEVLCLKDTVTAATSPPTAVVLAVPTDLVTSSVTATTLTVSGVGSTLASSFELYASQTGVIFALLSSSTTCTFNVTGLSAGTLYYFKIKAKSNSTGYIDSPFSIQSVVTTAPAPIVVLPNVAPTVALKMTASSVTQGSSVTLTAIADDTDGTVTRVEFLVDGIPVATDFTNPYSYIYTPSVTGSLVISARATDDAGATTTTIGQTLTVTSVPTTQLLFEGDSMTTDYADTSAPAYPVLLRAILDATEFFDYRNFAVPGQTTQQMINDAASQIDPLRDTTKSRQVIVVWAGFNDLTILSLEGLKQAIIDYHHARINAGYMTIALTLTRLIPDSSYTSYNAMSVAINQWIRDNKALIGYSALADVALDQFIGDQASLQTYSGANPYFADYIHHKGPGRQIVANYVKAAILALPAVNPYPTGITSGIGTGTSAPPATGQFIQAPALIQDNTVHPGLVKSGEWVSGLAGVYRNGSGAYTLVVGNKYTITVKASVVKMYAPKLPNTGIIRVKITRITTGVEVYNQTYDMNGAETPAGDIPKLTVTLPADDFYKIEYIYDTANANGVAFDDIEIL